MDGKLDMSHDRTSSAVLHSAMGPPTQNRHSPVRVGPEESHEDDQKAAAPLL